MFFTLHFTNMVKLYTSDQEICLFFKNDAFTSRDSSFPDKGFLDSLEDLFDKNGLFVPRKLRESAEQHEELYSRLSRSDFREMRYLGLSALLALDKNQYDSLFWEAFYDSFYPVRGLIVEQLQNRERNRLFNEIFKKLTGDPRQIIREKAFRRIKKDFSDLFTVRINNFTREEQYRLIMFLDGHTTHDYNILSDFISGRDDDLASRALYRIQKNEGDILNRWPERSRELNFLRYTSLSSFCHGGQEYFADAFDLIDDHTPPGLASQYVSELIKQPVRDERAPSYRKVFGLIGKMKGPRSRQLLEALYRNRELRSKYGPSMAEAFTRANQYYTSDFLEKLLREKPDDHEKEKLLQSAGNFDLPLSRTYEK